MSGGRLAEMCMEEGSREKKGSREEGVAGVRGAGDKGGGSSLMWASWLSRVSRTGGLLSRSVACTRKKASTAGCSTVEESGQMEQRYMGCCGGRGGDPEDVGGTPRLQGCHPAQDGMLEKAEPL